MNKYLPKHTKFTLFFIFLILFSKNILNALPPNVGVSIQVKSLGAKAGDIVSYDSGEYMISSWPYDSGMFGVVVQDPIADFQDTTISQNSLLVMSKGEAIVNVSNSSGDIKKGDYVTSSYIPGVAVKAKSNGYVLGMALEDHVSSNKAGLGQIMIYIDIKPNFDTSQLRGNILSVIKSALDSPYVAPLSSLRYLIAGVVLVVSFGVGFFIFEKVSGRSVEAMGRNPLAGSAIKSVVVMNFMLTFVIVGVGLGLSYLVLIL